MLNVRRIGNQTVNRNHRRKSRRDRDEYVKCNARRQYKNVIPTHPRRDRYENVEPVLSQDIDPVPSARVTIASRIGFGPLIASARFGTLRHGRLDLPRVPLSANGSRFPLRKAGFAWPRNSDSWIAAKRARIVRIVVNAATCSAAFPQGAGRGGFAGTPRS